MKRPKLKLHQAGFTISDFRQQWCRLVAAGQRRARFARSELRSAGFTIVELMVATLVFSVILLVITTGVLHITQMYYKGVNLVNTQNIARSVMDSVAQSIQFSGGTISWPQPATPGGTVLSGRGCVGDQAYDFQLGYQMRGSSPNPSDIQADHVLTLTTGVAACNQQSGSFNAGTTDLLGPHMRLTRFAVTPLAAGEDLYQVDATVVYGDYDLLCSPSVSPANGPGGCAPGAPTAPVNQAFMSRSDIRCKAGSGSEYCAVSALSTVVQQRLTTN